METLQVFIPPLTAKVSRDLQPYNKIQIRVVESRRARAAGYFDGEKNVIIPEKVLSDDVFSLDVPSFCSYLSLPIANAHYITPQIFGLGFGLSISSELSNRISSYARKLAYMGWKAMSVNAYVHVMRDVRIQPRGETKVVCYHSGIDEVKDRVVIRDCRPASWVYDHGSVKDAIVEPSAKIDSLKNENCDIRHEEQWGKDVGLPCCLYCGKQSGLKYFDIELPCCLY